ncbi:MAG: YgjV family protein [Bacteroidota bacterium]|nr:YgjV family protein [Bacteroidota bacterium]
MSSFIIQAIGYLASVLLAISLLVNNDLKFRWLNTGGCLAFIVYGIMINAFPIILTNTLLLLINLYTLLKIYKKSEDFDLLEFGTDATLIAKFLGFYEEDIKAYFPHFQLQATGSDIRFVVLRDIVIANVFVASLSDDGTAEVKLNYTVPKYRDYKVGRYIFNREKDYLLSKGVKRIVYNRVDNKSHEEFLKVMGFAKVGGSYIKEIS